MKDDNQTTGKEKQHSENSSNNGTRKTSSGGTSNPRRKKKKPTTSNATGQQKGVEKKKSSSQSNGNKKKPSTTNGATTQKKKKKKPVVSSEVATGNASSATEKTSVPEVTAKEKKKETLTQPSVSLPVEKEEQKGKTKTKKVPKEKEVVTPIMEEEEEHTKGSFGKVIRIFMATFTAVLAITAAITVLYYLYTTYEKGPTPEVVFNQYFDLLSNGHYDKLYDSVSDETKNAISRENFEARNKNIYTGIGAQNIQVKITSTEDKVNAKVFTYDMTLDTLGGPMNFNNKVLVKKNAENLYKLDWDDHIIFPGLTAEDKVWCETTQPIRGNIFDRKHRALAKWGTAYTVGVTPSEISKEDGNLENSVEKVAQALKLDKEELLEKAQGGYTDEDAFVELVHLTEAEKDSAQSKLSKIPGVSFQNDEVRTYPYGEMLGHLTGYLGGISEEEFNQADQSIYNIHSIIGKSGLEKAYEDRLRGHVGYDVVIKNKDDEQTMLLASKAVENGEDITVTIDVDVQETLYKQLEKDSGAAVAMDPMTGEVLAMVSTPSYDPNDFIGGIDQDKYDKLINDEEHPLLSRFSSTFAPGSSFKPITGAIGVTTGAIDPKKNDKSNGTKWQKDSSWGDHYVTTLAQYGTVNLKNALTYSDNIYFAKAALEIGQTELLSNLNNLGFNEELSFPVDISPSTYGDEATMTEGQLADSGYGQGQIMMSPFHLTMLYTSFNNEGNIVQPVLEHKEDGKPTYWKEDVFTQEAVNGVREGIIGVMKSGTGRGGLVGGMELGGKTGTAEIKASAKDKSGTELGWFVEMTINPESEKQLLVGAMIENVKGRGGSSYVVPKVRAAFQDLQNKKSEKTKKTQDSDKKGQSEETKKKGANEETKKNANE